MSSIRELEPRDVFSYFDDICHIPHGSQNIGQISDYCVNFAKDHGLRYRQEACGNVIIWKDASPGYEEADPVMLQGHLDMVTVKTQDCDIDMDAEGLRTAVSDDGEWVYAEGTSLGGDDGIAIAYSLAILADDELRHPALEAVFTVNEEIGLLGASALDTSDLKSRILLNMDSEEEGEFLTSCAGGATFKCFLPAERERVNGIVFEWTVYGLLGGHSGTDAHLGRANANDIFGRFLTETGGKVKFRIGDVSGGGKDNAIPYRCRAILVAQEEDASMLERATEEFEAALKSEYAAIEPDMKISLERTGQREADVLTADGDRALRIVLEHMPAGILRMEPEIPGMVQTSLNLGVLRYCQGTDEAGAASTEKAVAETEDRSGAESVLANAVLRSGAENVLIYAVRSSSRTQKEWLLQRMRDVTELAGGRWEIDGVYPAWEYVPDSRIRSVMGKVYGGLTGEEPLFVGIHAGVECGIFCEKMPGIDCISYGPSMPGAHSVRERMNIASVGRVYELTRRVLEKLD